MRQRSLTKEILKCSSVDQNLSSRQWNPIVYNLTLNSLQYFMNPGGDSAFNVLVMNLYKKIIKYY